MQVTPGCYRTTTHLDTHQTGVLWMTWYCACFYRRGFTTGAHQSSFQTLFSFSSAVDVFFFFFFLETHEEVSFPDKVSVCLLSRCCHSLLWVAKLFRDHQTWVVFGWKWFFFNHSSDLNSPSQSHFSLCAAALSWTKIAGVLGDAHTVCSPETYRSTLSMALALK